MHTIEKEIRYAADRNPTFTDEMKKLPGCENLDKCIQCGTCSGTCPLSIYMEHTPRTIIHLTREGFKDDVLASNTIWLCASCYSCTVECPKEVGITDIMYALKQRAINDGTYPKNFPIPTLAQMFFRMVRTNGRVSESRLAAMLFAKTQFWKLFGMWRLGLDLMRTGRFSLKAERMDHPEQLQRLLDAAEHKEAGR